MRLKNHYWFLRHGQTTWQEKALSYPPDNMTSVRLTAEGVKQILRAGNRLKKAKIDLIFSSDYLRTRQTARIISEILGLKANLDKRLRDTNLGVYHGKPKSELYQNFTFQERFKKRPKNGESWNDVRKRVKSFLKSTESKYSGKNILIVGHGDPLWLLDGATKELTDRQLLDIVFVKKDYIRKGELRKIS